MALTRKEREQQARRQYILDAATEVFAENGYENASMNEIAKRSEFTKRTLYMYFEDKADLFMSVVIEQYGQMHDFLQSYPYTPGNGYEIMKQSMEAYYAFFKQQGQTFRIMYDIGTVRQMTSNAKIEAFLEVDNRITESLVRTIKKGQDDGSISNSLDPMSLTVTYKFLMTGFFNQLTITGESYTRSAGIEMDAFADMVMTQIIKTLKV